jgi:DNA-binding XRE family transcriptional regulator
LRAARIAAGFTSAAKAAEHLGAVVPTYSAHENGQNSFNAELAKHYAQSFGTTAEWLLFGDGTDAPAAAKNNSIAIDPLLLETWKKLTTKQRKKLTQIALIISED